MGHTHHQREPKLGKRQNVFFKAWFQTKTNHCCWVKAVLWCSNGDWKYLWKRQQIYQRSYQELESKRINIRTGRTKVDTIQNILRRSNSLHQNADEVEKLIKSVETHWNSNSSPVHEFYREWFNLVDLSDRRWYSVEEHHSIHHWETKMLFAILRNATINSWVHSITEEYSKWREWRQMAYRNLMKTR